MKTIYSVVLTLPPENGGNLFYQAESDAPFTWLKTTYSAENGIPLTNVNATLLKTGKLIWQYSNISNFAGNASLPFELDVPITLQPKDTLLFSVDAPPVVPSSWPFNEAIVLTFGFDGSKPVAAGEILDTAFFPHSIPDLTTLQGSLTGATWQTLGVFAGYNVAGGNPALSYPPYISNDGMSEGWFVRDTDTFTFQLTGMPSGQYDIIFAGSRDGFDFGTYSGQVNLLIGETSGATVLTFNAANPITGDEAPHVTFTAVTPVAGVIQMSCTGFGAGNRCFLNSLAIVKKEVQNKFTLVLHGYKTYDE